MTLKRRCWSQKTVQKWADHWAAKLGLLTTPRIITDDTEFARLTGRHRRPRRYFLGISGADYTCVKTDGRTAEEIRQTVIHELLHLKHRSWWEWKINWTAVELIHGRSGAAVRSAECEADYLDGAKEWLKRKGAWPNWLRS